MSTERSCRTCFYGLEPVTDIECFLCYPNRLNWKERKRDPMYDTIKNHETGVIHARNSDKPDRGAPYSVCGCVGPYLQDFTVRKYKHVSMRNSMVTCKNCLRSLGMLHTPQRKRTKSDMNFIKARCLKANLVEQPKLINAKQRMPKGMDYIYPQPKDGNRVGPEIAITPYLNKPLETVLRFWGWDLVLRNDGTWDWSATDGG